MWSVRYEHYFDGQLTKLRDGNQHSRIDDIIDGVEWALANDPFLFETVGDTGLRVVVTDPAGGLSGFYVVYTIDQAAQRVCLQFLVEVEEFDEEDAPSSR